MLKSLSAMALALLVGAAQAGPPNVVEIVTQPLRRVSFDEGAEVKGGYDMSDGRAMLIRQRGRRVIVALDGVPETEVLALSGNHLLSRDRRMELVFDTLPNGYVKSVKVVLTTGLADARTAPLVLAGLAR